MTGFIGAGNMANAIIKGMVSSGAAEGKDIAVYDIHPEKREKAAADYGVNAVSSLEELVSGCSEIVVAIKPYGFEKLLGGLDAQLKYHDPLIISIAAGKTIDTISSYLSYEPALVRVMPNINATIGASMSAYCANRTSQRGTESICCKALFIHRRSGRARRKILLGFRRYRRRGSCVCIYVHRRACARRS